MRVPLTYREHRVPVAPGFPDHPVPLVWTAYGPRSPGHPVPVADIPRYQAVTPLFPEPIDAVWPRSLQSRKTVCKVS